MKDKAGKAAIRRRAQGGGHRAKRRYAVRAALTAACAALLVPSSAPALKDSCDANELFYLGLYQEIGLGDLKGAIETYSRITGGEEIAGKALFRKGICYEKSGEEMLALNCFNRAITNFPESPDIRDKALEGKMRLGSHSMSDYVNEGVQRDMSGDFTAARDMFRKALLIEPDNPSIQLRLASACRKLAIRENSIPQIKEAIRHYEDAASSNEFRTSLAVNRELAECYAKTDQTEETIKLWQAYLSIPGLVKSDRTMADYELELLRESADYFQKRDISLKMKDCLSEGEELTRNGDPEKAAKVYLQAKKEFPQSYIPPYRLAVLYELFFDKPKAAIGYYREALGMAPKITEQRIRCKMAVLYHGIGDLDTSVTYIDQCISKDIRFVERELELKVRRIKSEKSNLDRIKKEEEAREREREMLEKKRREEMRERHILERIRRKGTTGNEGQE